VAVPVGDRGAGNADLKDVRGAHHRHAGHVAAVAPAVHADARGINEWELRQRANTRDLVVYFDGAHAVGDGAFEGEPAVVAAAVVQLENDETLLRQVLSAEVD